MNSYCLVGACFLPFAWWGSEVYIAVEYLHVFNFFFPNPTFHSTPSTSSSSHHQNLGTLVDKAIHGTLELLVPTGCHLELCRRRTAATVTHLIPTVIVRLPSRHCKIMAPPFVLDVSGIESQLAAIINNAIAFACEQVHAVVAESREQNAAPAKEPDINGMRELILGKCLPQSHSS